MSHIGLKAGTVKLEPFSTDWKVYYENEKVLLLSLISDYITNIQHVGSTSINGCSAKPIIDISILVPNFNNIEDIIKLLSNNYTYKGNAGIEGRHFFVKGAPENRTHYIHVVSSNSDLWHNHVCFRDFLNKNEKYVIKYNELKQKLADQYSDCRAKYSDSKSDFILSMTNKAKIFYQLN